MIRQVQNQAGSFMSPMEKHYAKIACSNGYIGIERYSMGRQKRECLLADFLKRLQKTYLKVVTNLYLYKISNDVKD